MDFKQIEAFANVVKYGSFSKAADASFFSQPTISTHIQNLEKELGVKLLDRRGRSVEPTAYGRSFYKYAVEMINARSQAIDAIKGIDEGPSGIIEILSSTVPSVTFLPEFMAKFSKENKGVQYYLSVSDTKDVISSILDRRGELGFIGEDANSPLLQSHLICTDRSVLIAPSSYKIGREISIEESFDYPFIWRESGSATRSSFENALAAAGLDANSMRLAAIVDGVDAIVRNVEAGLGVSIISEQVASKLTGRVQIAELTDFDDMRSFYMIHLKRGSLSPAADAFANYITESLL